MNESNKEEIKGQIEQLQKVISNEKNILVKKEGEWLERYVELLFKLSGFETERNKRINAGSGFKKDVTHEIDVYIKTNSKPILVECKDVDKFKKSYVDSFFGKIADIKHSASLMCTTNLKEEELINFKVYCKRRKMIFLDGNELDQFVNNLDRINDIDKRKNYLLKFLKVQSKGFKKYLMKFLNINSKEED